MIPISYHEEQLYRKNCFKILASVEKERGQKSGRVDEGATTLVGTVGE